jgi:CheY-like chemotaxis protein
MTRMTEPEAPGSLLAFDHVLDRILTVLQAHHAHALEGAVRQYVEEAIEAAMGAAGRARDTPLVAARAEPRIEEAWTVATALLRELRATHRLSGAIVERSLELRRKAMQLTAAALTLSRPTERARATRTARAEARRTVESAGALQGVRVLLVGEVVDPQSDVGILLAAVGAQVHSAAAVEGALRVAQAVRPEVLVCDVSFPAAEGLICELRRAGVVAPALAVGPPEPATVAAGRAAGFAHVLPRPVTPAVLVRAVRAALGA